MVTHTLEGLRERVETLSKRSVRGFQIKDSLEADNIKAVCMGIVEDYTRPCEDRLQAANIAITAIELNVEAIKATATRIPARVDTTEPVYVRYGGRIVKKYAV